MDKFKKLVDAASEALGNAYVPTPDSMRFASAALSKKGNIYSSGQYYSGTNTLTLHTEQAILAHASAHGEHEVMAIASVGTEDPRGEKYCHPCGLCKQLLYEKYLRQGSDIDIIMANKKGAYIVKKISELVPYPWP